MNLYLLRPVDAEVGAWDPWYDKAFGFVVRAETEADARQVADTNAGDENDGWGDPARGSKRHPWLDPAQSTCVVLTGDGDPGLILRDFAAA